MKTISLFLITLMVFACSCNLITFSAENYKEGEVAMLKVVAVEQRGKSLALMGKPIEHTETLKKCLALPACKESDSDKSKTNLQIKKSARTQNGSTKKALRTIEPKSGAQKDSSKSNHHQNETHSSSNGKSNSENKVDSAKTSKKSNRKKKCSRRRKSSNSGNGPNSNNKDNSDKKHTKPARNSNSGEPSRNESKRRNNTLSLQGNSKCAWEPQTKICFLKFPS